jgi:hypothetical protein
MNSICIWNCKTLNPLLTFLSDRGIRFLSALFRNTLNCYDYVSLVVDKQMILEYWWNDND